MRAEESGSKPPALADRSYHVVLLCRNPQKADAARADIESTVPQASLGIVLADLSRMDQVRTAAAEIEQRLERLDVLVNNAGIQARHRESTPEGLDLLLATNHLGPFLLTNLLLPLLRESAPARIVNVASEAHKFSKLHLDDLQAARGYGPLGMRRYGETKLMNILFTRRTRTTPRRQRGHSERRTPRHGDNQPGPTAQGIRRGVIALPAHTGRGRGHIGGGRDRPVTRRCHGRLLHEREAGGPEAQPPSQRRRTRERSLETLGAANRVSPLLKATTWAPRDPLTPSGGSVPTPTLA